MFAEIKMAVAASTTEENNEPFSSVVKEIHSKLREKLNQGVEITELWSQHTQDQDTLLRYSQAMHSLAAGPWSKHEGGRIKWCVEICKEYFLNEDPALERFLRKDLRRQAFGNPTQLLPSLLPDGEEGITSIVGSFRNRKLELLDVGSCYNPFIEYSDLFNVTAVDIAPAVKDVLRCDFLNVQILPLQEDKDKASTVSPSLCPPPSKEEMTSIHSMKECSQDVIIFSLLLSYFPSTLQRMKCCINAHSILVPHGILLIITADSSHQNKHVDMIRSWTIAIEEIGFQRWKYFKDVHLHCMCFRKTTLNHDVSYYDSIYYKYHNCLYIQQDDSKK